MWQASVIRPVRDYNAAFSRLAAERLDRAKFQLADVQLIIAREQDFPRWPQ
jgi:hypothetical protein